MSDQVTEQCSALAFYGISPDIDLNAFMTTIESWFAEHSCPLTHGSIAGPGIAGRMNTAQAMHSRLERVGIDRVMDIDLVSALPDALVPILDYAMTGGVLKSYGDLAVVARSGIVPFGSPSLRSVAAKLVDIAQPAYGIGYTRDHRLGPAMYAHGLSQGLDSSGPDYLEALNISFWGDGRSLRIWEQGILRDLYPWNFLSPPQLDRPVGEVPLRRWIEQDASRGVLSSFGADLMLWEVSDETLPYIRRKLWDEGAIFNWPKHVEGAEGHPRAAEAGLLFTR